MDGIFGVIDERFKVSIVDSTMMLIVHRAMDRAHERVKSREGVIERLHEISKFYELSVMQLDGCIKFVQEETDTQNPETNHEEVLAGLAEIRNRLQRRLYESELAILQKDTELADRFESEVKLRQALEFTERELVSSQEDLQLERSRSAGSSTLSPREGDDDGDFGELKDSVDRQVWKIREKLEFDEDYEPNKVKSKRNHCFNDVRVDEMGSDIDILKETLDFAFGKMQSAIFVSEMGPIEQQVKSSIENDIMSIFLKGFVRDCQEDLEEEARRKEKRVLVSLNQHWSDLTNKVISLCEDLKPLIAQDEIMQPQKREDKTSLSSRREESSETLKTRFQGVVEKLENLMILNPKVNKTLGQNGDLNENHRQKSDVDHMHQLQDKENQIYMLKEEREDGEFQNIMMEEIYITLFQGLREKVCDDLSCWESKCLKLLELPHIPYEFEVTANRKLEAMMQRLEEMKHSLDPLPQIMASLRENESVYKKAFNRRCQNLRKAENEVDLLGDQVDILISLIEKIYSILNQQSPVLQQYFDVSEILRLIKEEVAVIVCTPPEKLDTTSTQV